MQQHEVLTISTQKKPLHDNTTPAAVRTFPISPSQSRKSRHQRSPSKIRRGRGSSTSSRDVGKSEKGNNIKWTPDPDTMSSDEFERSLTKFFRMYVGQTSFMILPYLIINFYYICLYQNDVFEI